MIEMQSLTQIGKEEFTKKVTHGFLDIYEELWELNFPPDRFKPIDLLEIGVYNGNSLKVWDRWFWRANIIGIDKHQNPIRPKLSNKVRIEYGDQADRDFLLKIANAYGPFDIIIDDGGHHWDEQQISFETLWDWVKPGGMYIIEDLHTSGDMFWRTEGYTPTVNYLISLVDRIVIYDERPDIKSIQFFNKLAVINKN